MSRRCFYGGAFRRSSFAGQLSGDFLPEPFVIDSMMLSVCELRLRFVERGVGEKERAVTSWF